MSPVSLASRHALGMKPRSMLISGGSPSLCRHVRHVVGVSPDEQVGGVNASGCIALVADLKSRGNRPVSKRIAIAMGQGVTASVETERSISRMRQTGGPDPTRWGLLDLGPESFRLGSSASPSRGAATRRAILRGLRSAGMNQKFGAAETTHDRDFGFSIEMHREPHILGVTGRAVSAAPSQFAVQFYHDTEREFIADAVIAWARSHAKVTA